MLIKDNNLDIEAFKSAYKTFSWLKMPRNLSRTHTDYFYVGSYEDDEKIINVEVRPSMRMKVQESFKGFDAKGTKTKNGKYNFGSTVEVVISDATLEKIKLIAKPRKENAVQKVDL